MPVSPEGACTAAAVCMARAPHGDGAGWRYRKLFPTTKMVDRVETLVSVLVSRCRFVHEFRNARSWVVVSCRVLQTSARSYVSLVTIAEEHAVWLFAEPKHGVWVGFGCVVGPDYNQYVP